MPDRIPPKFVLSENGSLDWDLREECSGELVGELAISERLFREEWVENMDSIFPPSLED
jgi:hypothetical protein